MDDKIDTIIRNAIEQGIYQGKWMDCTDEKESAWLKNRMDAAEKQVEEAKKELLKDSVAL